MDIRLGAKYLLTLTSYYYEREWKFMAMITLQNSRNAEVTVLTNNFIDNYMPGANGEFVKVYIYLLRLLSDTSVPFSLEQMADHFFCTERDIIRALKYWEKEKLLTLTYRNNEDIADIILNVPPVKSAASDTTVSAAPVTKTEPQTSSAPAQPVKQTTRSATALSPDRVKELKQNDEIVQLLYIAEQYLGKTLTPTEMKKILFFYDELKFSPDLIEYLIEYSVSRGHKSMRYIETVALAWADEGITTVTMAKEANSRYAKEYFTIFKSMGISGRNPVDTEISLMNTWLNDYGFTMDIIQEACSVQFSLPDSQVSSMQIKSFPGGKIKMSVHLQMSGSSMLSISARSWKRIPSGKQLPNRLHQTGLTISISDSTTLTNMKRNY